MAGFIGILIGLVLGLTGAGGSVLAVPLLMGGLGLGLAPAAGISSGAVALAALAGVLMRLHQRQIAWAPALFLALGGMLLTPLGRWLAQHLPELPLLVAFAGLVAVVAWRMWRQAGAQPEATRVLRAGRGAAAALETSCRFSASGRFELRLPCVIRLLALGAVTGVLSGLFGVGGGFVIVPALVLLTGLPMVYAVATSLVVITAISGAGFLVFLGSDGAASAVLLPVALGGVGGMLLGTLLAPRWAGPTLQRIFVVLMLVLAAATVIRAA